MKNTIVAIGYLSDVRVYLNVTREVAIERYIASTGCDRDDISGIKEFKFEDEFGAYDVWAP